MQDVTSFSPLGKPANLPNLPEGLYILLALISSSFSFFYNKQSYLSIY